MVERWSAVDLECVELRVNLGRKSLNVLVDTQAKEVLMRDDFFGYWVDTNFWIALGKLSAEELRQANNTIHMILWFLQRRVPGSTSLLGKDEGFPQLVQREH